MGRDWFLGGSLDLGSFPSLAHVPSGGAMRGLAARERDHDLRHELPGGGRGQLDRDALTRAVRLADEVDAERMVERRVKGVVEIDIGGIDAHPAAWALGAAG